MGTQISHTLRELFLNAKKEKKIALLQAEKIIHIYSEVYAE